MNDQKITIDFILDWFKDAVEKKLPIRPADWIESALKLNVLVESIDDTIAEAEGKMADKEMELLGAGETAAFSKKMMRQAVEYTAFLKLVAKRKRVEEFIRLAKKRAELEKMPTNQY